MSDDYSTLTIAKYVANAVNSLRRRNNLSWAHHREIASLEPEEQDKFLDLAEQYDYSPSGLLHLAIAVIEQAVKDAKSQDRYKGSRAPMAQSWLVETGAIWFDCLGLDGEAICQSILRQPARKLWFEWANRKRTIIFLGQEPAAYPQRSGYPQAGSQRTGRRPPG